MTTKNKAEIIALTILDVTQAIDRHEPVARMYLDRGRKTRWEDPHGGEFCASEVAQFDRFVVGGFGKHRITLFEGTEHEYTFPARLVVTFL